MVRGQAFIDKFIGFIGLLGSLEFLGFFGYSPSILDHAIQTLPF
jgi:hypothetical protein